MLEKVSVAFYLTIVSLYLNFLFAFGVNILQFWIVRKN